MDTELTEVSLAKRNNYYSGKLLSADDLNAEQTYLRTRLRYHNRLLLGCGCVSGLKVCLSKDDCESVVVHPGFAVDPHGNEIIITSKLECPVPQDGERTYLVAYWAERETDFVPLPGAQGAGGQTVASRLEEYAILKYEADPERGEQSGLVLARLKKKRRKWKVDKKFRAREAKA